MLVSMSGIHKTKIKQFTDIPVQPSQELSSGVTLHKLDEKIHLMKKNELQNGVQSAQPPEEKKEENMPSTALQKKTERHGKKRRHTYVYDVYKKRFRHFRTLRLLSLFVGVSIFLLLVLGMWQLYIMVFSTIEDTEHIFNITEKRRIYIIDFQILEKVRASWDEKYITTTTSSISQIFWKSEE